ncbi:hypothetical protein SADUNF_Sadunf19G0109200 [Salix dunnii]|uniref:Uncharacterized protein n=1 Tax=Salix dunnii TaxID=1413687 RepID=A0A835J2V7_9ROSI|nr:hypothetical protein SADUNF_Sadunf19G0109200 [Salix dunnii]
MVKATLVDKNGFRKGAWSKEEDDKLRVYVQKYGHWNWRQLPKFAVSSGLVDKEQSRETSQSEDSQTEKSETESVYVNDPSEPHHQPEILENFPSPQEISCSEFSSMNNDSVSSVKGTAADGLSPMEIFQDSGSDFWNQPFLADNNDNPDGFSPNEIFQDSGSDFWNQPFLADNNDNQDGYHSLLFTEEVYMHSCAFNYDDDSIDWIHQMMQELQDSN